MVNPSSRRKTFAGIDQLQAQIADPWPEVCTAAVRTIIETPDELRVARRVRIGFVDYEPEQRRILLVGCFKGQLARGLPIQTQHARTNMEMFAAYFPLTHVDLPKLPEPKVEVTRRKTKIHNSIK